MSDTRNFASLPKTFSVSLQVDADGWLGRECPQEGCKRYFKVTPGTGLKDIKTCRCPYCGHEGASDTFHTQAQIDHAVSVVKNEIAGVLLQNLKLLEFRQRGGGLTLTMEVTGEPPRIRGYSEQDLETEIVCDACTLRYAIYGVFGFCADCGVHNNLNILDANLCRVKKMLVLATIVDADIARDFVENALEDCVSAFDGWGRAVCEAFADKAADPSRASKVSFQNIKRAHDALKIQFGFDADAVLGTGNVEALHRAFQKRHLLAHRMGVVDGKYLRQTGDMSADEGRRITIVPSEVEETIASVLAWAKALNAHLGRLS